MWSDTFICDVTHWCVLRLIRTRHNSWRTKCSSMQEYRVALSCRSFSAKEPLIIGLFCEKWPIKIRHSMGLCHLVSSASVSIYNITYTYVTWLIHTWHDSFIRDVTHSYVTRLIHTWRDSFIRDMTHSYVTWLIHTWHDSFICDATQSYVTWLIHMWRALFRCDMTHSYVT